MTRAMRDALPGELTYVCGSYHSWQEGTADGKAKKKNMPRKQCKYVSGNSMAPACTISLNKIENEQMSNESVDCPEKRKLSRAQSSGNPLNEFIKFSTCFSYFPIKISPFAREVTKQLVLEVFFCIEVLHI